MEQQIKDTWIELDKATNFTSPVGDPLTYIHYEDSTGHRFHRIGDKLYYDTNDSNPQLNKKENEKRRV